jgi:hypothetical protein
MEYYRYSSDQQWTPQNPSGQGGLLWWDSVSFDWLPVETFSPIDNLYSSLPETLLTEVVRINFWLDSVGVVLRSLSWLGACVDSSYNNNDLLGCGAGYLDSIRSHNPADEPHWVQVGFFENATADTSYFMLVNRECLETEGASYDVFVTKSGGPYQIKDIYTDSVVDYVNGTGDYFTIYLGPGEGKLLRLKVIYHGDANGDGMINIVDLMCLINYLFIGGPAPEPLWAGDANCDGVVNIADLVYLINYLFIGGPQPCELAKNSGLECGSLSEGSRFAGLLQALAN